MRLGCELGKERGERSCIRGWRKVPFERRLDDLMKFLCRDNAES